MHSPLAAFRSCPSPVAEPYAAPPAPHPCALCRIARTFPAEHGACLGKDKGDPLLYSQDLKDDAAREAGLAFPGGDIRFHNDARP